MGSIDFTSHLGVVKSVVPAVMTQLAVTYPLDSAYKLMMAQKSVNWKDLLYYRGAKNGIALALLSRSYGFIAHDVVSKSSLLQHSFFDNHSYLKHYMSAFLFSLPKSFLMHPLDLNKVWCQLSKGRPFNFYNRFTQMPMRSHLGIIACLECRAGMGYGTWFASLEVLDRAKKEYKIEKTDYFRHSIGLNFLSGSVAHLFTSTIVMPIDWLKIVLQNEQKPTLNDFLKIGLYNRRLMAVNAFKCFISGGVFQLTYKMFKD